MASPIHFVRKACLTSISMPFVTPRPHWVQAILATACFVVCSACIGHELVVTKVSGVLLSAKRPVPDAVITGCTDFRSYKSASCSRPFRTTTDAKGKFSFSQETGYPECTVCPCKLGIPSACDPSWFIWFRAEKGEITVLFNAISMGNGLISAEFECDLEAAKSLSVKKGNAHSDPEVECQPTKYTESRSPRDRTK